jgi:hypothetical protein
MSQKLATTLGHPLDWKVRQHFVRAYEALWRELDFALERRKSGVMRLVSKGWTPGRLRVVAVLNAFTRTVLGPLATAMDRKTGVELGLSRPIRYGRIVTISRETNIPVMNAIAAFDAICIQRSILLPWLYASRMDDIVYRMNRSSDGETQDPGE